MNPRFMGIFLKILAVTAICCAPLTRTYADEWPPLPKQGFITGRVATMADMASGEACFVVSSNGQAISKPIVIQIPQYVYLKGPQRTKGILVQAEEAQGIRAYGVVKLDGKKAAVTEAELEFLGTAPPAASEETGKTKTDRPGQ